MKVSSSVFLPVSAFWEFSFRFLSSVKSAVILRGRVCIKSPVLLYDATILLPTTIDNHMKSHEIE